MLGVVGAGAGTNSSHGGGGGGGGISGSGHGGEGGGGGSHNEQELAHQAMMQIQAFKAMQEQLQAAALQHSLSARQQAISQMLNRAVRSLPLPLSILPLITSHLISSHHIAHHPWRIRSPSLLCRTQSLATGSAQPAQSSILPLVRCAANAIRLIRPSRIPPSAPSPEIGSVPPARISTSPLARPAASVPPRTLQAWTPPCA